MTMGFDIYKPQWKELHAEVGMGSSGIMLSTSPVTQRLTWQSSFCLDLEYLHLSIFVYEVGNLPIFIPSKYVGIKKSSIFIPSPYK